MLTAAVQNQPTEPFDATIACRLLDESDCCKTPGFAETASVKTKGKRLSQKSTAKSRIAPDFGHYADIAVRGLDWPEGALTLAISCKVLGSSSRPAELEIATRTMATDKQGLAKPSLASSLASQVLQASSASKSCKPGLATSPAFAAERDREKTRA